VVLREHYHVVVSPPTEEGFSDWIRALHSRTCLDWNREDGTPGCTIWYDYWDTTLWTQGDLWSRINYTHTNPVKHGYVTVASDWEWSSLRQLEAYWCEPEPLEGLSRFPPPLKLPKDDF
jgi:putative transposase